MDKLEIKKARKLAHITNLMVAIGNRRYAYRQVDLRTRVGKLAMKLVKKEEFKKNSDEIQSKRKIRASRKRIPSFVNIFERPIVRDYLNNGYKLRVLENRLTDGYRNHWAKNKKDLRILGILKK